MVRMPSNRWIELYEIQSSSSVSLSVSYSIEELALAMFIQIYQRKETGDTISTEREDFQVV